MADISHYFSSPEPKAHGELIVYQSSRRLSVRPSFLPSTLSNMNISETNGSSVNQILSEASLGRGKGCIRFWTRWDQDSCQWQRIAPIGL